jgi:hypothetical protein
MSSFNIQSLNKYYFLLENCFKTGKDNLTPLTFKRKKRFHFNVIQNKTTNNTYKFTPLKEIQLTNGRIVTIPTIRDRIVIEIIKNKLKKKYNIKFINRETIIKKLILKLNNDIPSFVIRLDIKNFYPSVSHRTLYEKLSRSSLVGFEELNLIKKLLKLNGTDGLPQGLSVSSILSEIYLEDFDKMLKLIHPRISLYYRYVDDIIILINGTITNETLNEIKSSIVKIFNKYNLLLNDKKTSYIQYTPSIIINKKNLKLPLVSPSFDYLGYQFNFNGNTKLSISSTKVKKILNKLDYYFKDYLSNRNISLLIERLKFITYKKSTIKTYSFLTKNEEIITKKRKIYFGITESYKHVPASDDVWGYLDRYMRGKILMLKQKGFISNSKDFRHLHSYSFYKSLEQNYILKFNKLTKKELALKLTNLDNSLKRHILLKETRFRLLKQYFELVDVK